MTPGPAPLPELLQENLGDSLTRSAVQRQLGIVLETLRVSLVEQPSLRQTWLDVDALLAGCARIWEWEQGEAFVELAAFIAGYLKVWQGRLAEGLRLQQEERERLDQQIAENLRRLGYEF